MNGEHAGMLLVGSNQVRLHSFCLILVFAFPAKTGDTSGLTDSGTLFFAGAPYSIEPCATGACELSLAFIDAHEVSQQPDIPMDQTLTPPPSFRALRVYLRTRPRAHSTASARRRGALFRHARAARSAHGVVFFSNFNNDVIIVINEL